MAEGLMVPAGVVSGGDGSFDVVAVGDASSFGNVVNRCEVFQSPSTTCDDARDDLFRDRRGVNDCECEREVSMDFSHLLACTCYKQLVIRGFSTDGEWESIKGCRGQTWNMQLKYWDGRRWIWGYWDR